jgi:diguanylate cyclase (GGDEF)-like protein/PAS domain S-box-containing protein
MKSDSETKLEQKVAALFQKLSDQKKEWQQRLDECEDRYHRLVNATSEGYLRLDLDLLILETNNAVTHMLGQDEESLIGCYFNSLYDKRTVEIYFATPDHISLAAEFKTKQGTVLPLLINRSVMYNKADEQIGYVVFLTDMSELKNAQKKIETAEQRYRSMYENAVQGMFQATLTGQMIHANPACARLLGFKSPDQLLAPSQDMDRFFCDLKDRIEMTSTLEAAGVLENHEVKFKRNDGRKIWLLVTARLIRQEGSDPIIEGIMLDHTGIKIAREKLQRSKERYRNLATHDSLTGLYNTRYLYRILDRLILEHGISKEPFSVIFMDMDNFKQIVDTHGHLNGSQALAEVARTIKASIHDPCVGVAYGGDEFVIVLPGFNRPEALTKAKEIRHKMKSMLYLSRVTKGVHLEASFGVATFPEDAKDRAGLLALADQAMFRIKSSGKDAVG